MRDKLDFGANYGIKENTSIIKVIGVGGGGGNAVQHMYSDGIIGADFLICNTDRQALENNRVPSKLVLGESGLGAGANPEVARELAISSREKIAKFIGHETKMLFITAGMGKGTGTGASPVVAEIAKEMGILTIGVVTFPFMFEGGTRADYATAGIQELKKHVDALLVIKNQNLIKYYSDLTVDTGFSLADEVLENAVKCITELITVHAEQNVDFNDIATIMRNSGEAMLGLATAEGENRIEEVVDKALNCPLLNEDIIKDAKNFLFFISYGPEKKLLMSELDELTQKFEHLRAHNSTIIWGRAEDETLGKQVKLSVIITNYNKEGEPVRQRIQSEENKKYAVSQPAAEPTATFELSGAGAPAESGNADLFNSSNFNNFGDFSGFTGFNNTPAEAPAAENHAVAQEELDDPWNSARNANFNQKLTTSPRNYHDENEFNKLYNTPTFMRAQQTNTQTLTQPTMTTRLEIENDDAAMIFRNIPD